jgi:hypothetical protein
LTEINRRGRPNRDKKIPRMANRLSSNDHRCPRQQIQCLLICNFRDVKTGMYIKRRAGNEHWTMGPPRTNHSYRSTFSQQTAFSQAKSREQAADHNQRTVQRGSTFLTFRAPEMQPRHLPQFDSFPMTDSHLQIGLMPDRTRRVQPQRFRLAFLPP